MMRDIIRRFFAWFWSKVLHRTGYKAMIDGRIIDGCGFCGFNRVVRLHTLPAHYCTDSFNSYGEFNTIYDPCDIPEFCPHRVISSEVKS